METDCKLLRPILKQRWWSLLCLLCLWCGVANCPGAGKATNNLPPVATTNAGGTTSQREPTAAPEVRGRLGGPTYPEKRDPVRPPDIGGSLLRVTGALAVVVAVGIAGIYFFKRFLGFGIVRGGAQELQILEMKSLGGRQAM